MSKHIIIENDHIDVLREGYNIIEKSIYGDNVPEILIQSLEFAVDNLDMDNMDAINVLSQLIETLKESK